MDIRTVTPDLLDELRKRSQSGYLNRLIGQVTPIKPTIQNDDMTEKEYQELVSSILDD